MRLATILLAALLATTAVACGSPKLSEQDGADLRLARDRAIAAVTTEQRIADSPAAAERLLARVRKIVASGAFEAKQLDEFGLAALGELRLVAPSLVIVDRQEVPRQLDRPALTAFLEQVLTDPSKALKPAATVEVANIDRIVESSGAGADSDIPGVGMTVDVYLADLAARLEPVWPDLAAKLQATRAAL